jgi:hypothetical protein
MRRGRDRQGHERSEPDRQRNSYSPNSFPRPPITGSSPTGGRRKGPLDDGLGHAGAKRQDASCFVSDSLIAFLRAEFSGFDEEKALRRGRNGRDGRINALTASALLSCRETMFCPNGLLAKRLGPELRRVRSCDPCDNGLAHNI